MTKVTKNESGFGVVEIFLLLVIAAVMVFMGVYVLRTNRTVQAPASSSAPSPTTTTTPPVIKPSTTTPDITIQKITYDNAGTKEQLEIKKQLYDFYTAWNQLSSNAEQYSAKAIPTNEAYLSRAGQQQLATETSYNLFTCSQMKLQYLAIGEPAVANASATVTLTAVELGTAVARKPIKLSLIKQNSKWFIDHVTCSF